MPNISLTFCCLRGSVLPHHAIPDYEPLVPIQETPKDNQNRMDRPIRPYLYNQTDYPSSQSGKGQYAVRWFRVRRRTSCTLLPLPKV